jgi:hypothetical protein
LKKKVVNPITKPINDFSRWYAVNGAKVRDDVTAAVRKLPKGATAKQIRAAVDAVYVAAGFDVELVTRATEAVTTGFAMGSALTVSASLTGPAGEFVQTAETFAGGRALQTIIGGAKTQDIVFAEIFKAKKNLTLINKIIDNLGDSGATQAKLSRAATDLLGAARKSFLQSMDAAGYKKLEKTISKVRQNAARLDRYQSRGLQRALDDMATAAENGAETAFEAAADRAVMFKARYNAERIVRTETARANGIGKTNAMLEDDDIVSMRWILSSSHDIFDVCNVNAEADSFGLGTGVYPKDNFPEYPAHPNCMCSLSPVRGVSTPKSKYNPKAADKFVDSLPASQQKRLRGVDKKGPIAQYTGPVKKTITR